MKRQISLLTLATTALFVLSFVMISSCTKEGPAGKDGTNGADGANGLDGTASCITCHSPEGIELAAVQYEISKHSYGEEAFSLAGNTGCGACHLSEAFKFVCQNNTPSTFSLNTTTNRYVNDYVVPANVAYGEINCGTCHSSIHTTYGAGDLALTTVAPVSMNMWGGAKTINLQADGGRSNLCVKCHQPRPLTNAAGDGNVLDYAGLVANPSAVFFNPDGTGNKLRPAYRTHVHYGSVGAIYAGVGGVEFSGVAYTNSVHTALASCQDCHMSPMQGKAGGHTFFAKGNFNGCNDSGCHTDVSANSAALWTTPRANVKAALDALAAALSINGVDFLNRNPGTSNLWITSTTNKYDGYLNVYDPINNPDGPTYNPAGVFQNPAPANSWSQAQKDYNLTLPKITLTNAQMGAIINFQLVLRDYSLGIHNYSYTMALLQNSLSAIGSKGV